MTRQDRSAELDTMTRLAAMEPGERWIYYVGGSLGKAAAKDEKLAAMRDALWQASKKGVCALNLKRKSWGRTVSRADGRLSHNVGSEFEYIATRR